jgi:hypothetical protein
VAGREGQEANRGSDREARTGTAQSDLHAEREAHTARAKRRCACGGPDLSFWTASQYFRVMTLSLSFSCTSKAGSPTLGLASKKIAKFTCGRHAGGWGITIGRVDTELSWAMGGSCRT